MKNLIKVITQGVDCYKKIIKKISHLSNKILPDYFYILHKAENAKTIAINK